MADSVSDRFSFPLLAAGQAQKEITHNEALSLIDMLLHPQVQSASLAEPPSEKAAGMCWIIPPDASGAWSGKDGMLAGWTSGGWRFVAPVAGMRLSVIDENEALFFDGTNWRVDAIRSDGLYINNEKIVGHRESAIADASGGAVIDAEGRAVITQILGALRNHGLIEPA